MSNKLLNRSLNRAGRLVSAVWLCLALGPMAYGQTLLYKWSFDNATGSGASLAVPPAVVDAADGYTGGNLSVFVNGAGGTLSTPAGSGLYGDTNALDLGLVNSGLYNSSAAGALAGDVGDMSKITNFTVSLWFNLNAAVANFGSVNGAGFNGRLFCIDTNKNGTGGTAADGNELYLALAAPAAGAGPLRIQFGVFIASGQPFASPFGNVGGALAATFTNQWVFIAASYTQAANGTANIYVGTTNQGVSLAATMTGVGSFTNAAKTWLATSNLVEIGNRINGTGNRALMGTIDDVRLYGSALTLPQIQAVQGVVSPPVITIQPTPSLVYPGQSPKLTVSAAGTLPLSYEWTRNGTNLIDGGNISGSSSNILTISGVSAADLFTNYSVIVTNVAGAVTSSVASLALTSPSGAYESAVVADAPFAFYTFSETNDPSTGIAEAYDSISAFNGTYGTTALNAFNGIVGPQATADGLIGFSDTNAALGATYLQTPPTSFVTLPPFNLNSGAGTNVLTITAWINPSGPQVHAAAIVFSRSGTTTAGLVYNATNNNDGNLKLGYNWNNDVNTYSWDSGLEATPGIWSLVALVVTPTNATIYVINTNGLLASTHIYNHVPQIFEGPTLIGNDSQSANGNRNFNGSIDEVALFGQALSQTQVASLYSAASGITFFAPIIGGEPVWPSFVLVGQTASATISAGGTAPLTYQWQAGLNGNYTNLTDGGNISGSATGTLTITNAQLSNNLDYIVTITNVYGAATSTPPATLVVTPLGPPLNVTLSTQMPLSTPNTDWNSPGYWSDTNGGSLGASNYIVADPHTTFEVLAGGRLRTPNPATGPFPGDFTDSLQLDGVGVLDTSGATMGELRCKSTPVTIAHLIMNGGQLDASVGTGAAAITVVNGQMDVLTNSIIYDDSANDQGMTINSFLTGQGNIELDNTGFALADGTPLNIAGQTNTYSGTWNVVLGVLLGTGVNALGTNAITVGSTGYLETTYDINNPNGSLTLDGQLLLHQNDHFASVTVSGTPLANGTYSFAALNSAYPVNFPASWPQQTGSAFTTGSGQIIVGIGAPPSPRFTSIRLSGTALSIAATNGMAGGPWTLLQSTNITLPLSQWQTNAAGNFDGSGNLSTNILNTATNLQEFYILKGQ